MNRCLGIVLCLGSLAGCGPGFALDLPDRFVELSRESGRGDYELRATTPDGVVVGVDVIDNRDHGTLAFYQEAILRRMRDQQGYALLSEEDVHAASGQPGHVMRFGRDLNGRSYRYTIAVFASESTSIYLVEAGGREAQYAVLEGQIETSIAQIRF